MRRLLVAALAIGLAAIGLPASADLTSSSPAPPYLSGTGHQFYASANKAWSGAKELTADASNNPLGKPPGEWDPDTVIWTKSCSSKAQTASFKRTLKLPGKPVTSEFYVSAVFPSSAPGAFSTWTLKVNGSSALKGTFPSSAYTGEYVQLPAKALTSFRNGQNLVEVTVKRKALPKGQKKCNTSDADRYGVQFRFKGDFDADLALFDGPVQSVIYRKGGSTNTSVTNISVRNDGPSGLVAGGTFWARVSGVKEVVNLSDSPTPIPGTYPAGPPFDHCESVTVTPTPNLVVEITCTLTAMPAGMGGFLSIGTLQEFASVPATDTSTLLQWKVSHPADSTYDNQRSAQYVWCGSASTTPGCLALG